MAIDFVKFIRGSEESYQRLLDNNVTDKNTLYFVYDKNSTAANPTGKLYLDKFLISGNSDELKVSSLKDLLDTQIGTLTGKEFLCYDKSIDKWKPVLPIDFMTDLNLDQYKTKVLSDIIKENDEEDLEALQRTNPSPNEGDIGVIDKTVYVFNGDTWAKAVDPSDYVTFESDKLLTDEQKDKLNRLVIEDGEIKISGNVDAENVNGLNDYINQHQYIKSVDENIFQVTSNGELELKPNYLPTELFNSTVGNLTNLINRVSNTSTLVDEINAIKTVLSWTDM